MKKQGILLFTLFYLAGALILPFGDFAMLKDLPDMFRHCKATEDRDLNVVEFFAEHVLALGQLIEGTEHEGDEEEDGDKPHTPIQIHFERQQIICVYHQLKAPAIKPVPAITDSRELPDVIYISSYSNRIFRPPMV